MPREPADIENDLITSIARGECILFVGAGFSNAATGSSADPLKTASELAKSILSGLGRFVADGTVEAVRRSVSSRDASGATVFQLRKTAQYFVTEVAWSLASGSAPTEMAKAARANLPAAREELLQVMRSNLDRNFDRAVLDPLAHFFGLDWAAIYTTNYDRLIEDALSVAGREFAVTTRSADLVLGGDHLEIVKIHGSVSELHLDHQVPLVVTADDYAEFRKTRGLLIDELRVNLAQRDFLFLGYGLQDENLDSVIREVFDVIATSPRRLWVQFRGAEENPELTSLRIRGFSPVRIDDITAFVADLPDRTAEFRTAHDLGYLEFAIRDRDSCDEAVDVSEFNDAGASVARALWDAQRAGTAGTPSMGGILGDRVTALYHLLTAKTPSPGRLSVWPVVQSGLQSWLRSSPIVDADMTVQGYHRLLECLSRAAPYLATTTVSDVRAILTEGSGRFPDTLTRWLELQTLQLLQRERAIEPVVSTYCVEMAERWCDDPESPSGAALRPVVPRLASMIANHGSSRALTLAAAEQTGGLMLAWELGKSSGSRLARAATSVTYLSDGAQVPSAEILDEVALRADVAGLRRRPVARRASLRAAIMRIEAGGFEAADLRALVELDRELIVGADITPDAVEPYFAAFAVLEHLGVIREKSRSSTGALHDFYLLLMEIMREATARQAVADDEAGGHRARHFLTATTRAFLRSIPVVITEPDWSDDDDTALQVTLQSVLHLASEQTWLLENVLNVTSHMIRLGELPVHDGAKSAVARMLRRYVRELREGDAWDDLSPILRYYIRRAMPDGRGWSD